MAAEITQPPRTEQRAAALSERKQALLATLRARRAGAAADPDRVVTLRPGTDPGLVLVHPVGGHLLCYAELVRLLPPGPAIRGLEADRAARTGIPTTMEAMAARYLDRLRRAGVRPSVLAGWSFGGILAVEMAGQLARRGDGCPVIVLDAAPLPPEYPVRLPDTAEVLRAFAEDAIRSAGAEPGGLPDEVSALDPSQALARLSGFLAGHGGTLGVSEAELAERLRVFTNNKIALDGYRLRPDGIRPSLLWAADTPVSLRRYWRSAMDRPEEAPAVPANHYSLLRRPAVQAVTELLWQMATGIRGDKQ